MPLQSCLRCLPARNISAGIVRAASMTEGELDMPLALEERKTRQTPRGFMKANVFRAPYKFGLEEKPIPSPGAGDAGVQVRLTTICGTDIHIVRGEYPVSSGLTIGHECVGVIHELG